MAPKEFIDWLKNEMKDRNWGIRETALKVGVSHPTISDIITNGKQPSFETVKSLSKTFHKNDVYLLRLAGLLDPEPEYVPLLGDWNDVFHNLTEDEQQELLDIARMKVERRSKSSQKTTSRGRKTPARSLLIE